MTADIRKGADSSYPFNLTVLNNKLYFSVTDGEQGIELWEYDGANPPQMVAVIVPGDEGSGYTPADFTVLGDKLCFVARHPDYGRELWVYDGTNPPQLLDIAPGPADGNPGKLIEFKGKLYFGADDEQHGDELFEFDGTNPPALVAEIYPGEQGSNPIFFTVYKNKLYFNARDGYSHDGGHGCELWVYDGANPPQMIDVNEGADSSSPNGLFVFNDQLYFSADDGKGHNGLWVYDGSHFPEFEMEGIHLHSSILSRFVILANKLYFVDCDVTYGWEIAEYDFNRQPVLLADISQDSITGGYIPSYLTVFNNKLYFYHNDRIHGFELWEFDGSDDPPKVSITEPGSGAVVNETQYIRVNYLDDRLSGKVEYFVDDQKIGQVTAKPYDYAWNTSIYADGPHTVKVIATDHLGQQAESMLPVTIDNANVPPPAIALNRIQLNFGYVPGVDAPAAQTFAIANSGGSILNPQVTANRNWINLSAVLDSQGELLTVTVDPTGKGPGTYAGSITVTSSTASNSPRLVEVILTVYSKNRDAAPFGSFDTPVAGSTVMSSVPFTGWALDDVGIDNVKIYLESGDEPADSKLAYIGKAVFIEGARPDIPPAYPGYPLNYKAGWGYMMLTNFLPNNGNGTFTFHAVASDVTGKQVTLDTRTVIVDNANAVKPFGSIDQPRQGATIYLFKVVKNTGWVLTPPPNKIPESGNTIFLYVDGVPVGNVGYNNYRSDIATWFPGYANSGGAGGEYYLDLSSYENGLHTIAWAATDDAGNRDGIGSRYFNIQFPGNTSSASSNCSRRSSALMTQQAAAIAPVLQPTATPVTARIGCTRNIAPQTFYPDNTATAYIGIRELERVNIQLGEQEPRVKPIGPHDNKRSHGIGSRYSGFLAVGKQALPLPIGSFLDREKGIFYWQPGVGFIGDYCLVFLDNCNQQRKTIHIRISPRYHVTLNSE